MKNILLGFFLLVILIGSVMLIMGYRRVGPLDILNLPNGYVINDRERSITFFADWDVGNVSITKDNENLISFFGDFRLKNDKFRNSLDAKSDVGKSGLLIVDKSADGIPDSIVLTTSSGKSREKFKLRTFAVDENGKIVYIIEKINNVLEARTVISDDK
jgi:hypothetical protein